MSEGVVDERKGKTTDVEMGGCVHVYVYVLIPVGRNGCIAAWLDSEPNEKQKEEQKIKGIAAYSLRLKVIRAILRVCSCGPQSQVCPKKIGNKKNKNNLILHIYTTPTYSPLKDPQTPMRPADPTSSAARSMLPS